MFISFSKINVISILKEGILYQTSFFFFGRVSYEVMRSVILFTAFLVVTSWFSAGVAMKHCSLHLKMDKIGANLKPS